MSPRLPRTRLRDLGVLCMALLSACLHGVNVCAATLVSKARPATRNTTQVHVIFSNHLDIIGFTDLDNNVINLYFHEHFPRAARLGRWMREHGRGDNFIYLTHSYLVSLFLDCPPHMGVLCPEDHAIQEFKAAVHHGDITWHAMPYNPQYEVFDPELLEAALDLTHGIDKQLHQRKKTTVSLRDVPGLTRAAIPILAAKGVRALSGGVNGFSAPPAVPKYTPFIWLDPQSGKQILAMWHPGGYGGWTRGVQVDGKKDCITHPDFDHVLCVSWRDDNAGPPENPEQAQAMFATLRTEFPEAHVFASTFDAYIDALEEAALRLRLPVITGEIGDTWVHGIQSDVTRVADYRAALRARRHCLNDDACDSNNYAFANFTRFLLKVPEHTWGIAFNQYLQDASNYTNAYLHARLAKQPLDSGYATVIDSWRRQYAYITWALEALPHNHPVAKAVADDIAARKRLVQISRKQLLHAGYAKVDAETAAACLLHFRSCSWEISVHKHTGNLVRLVRLHGRHGPGTNWAGEGSAMAQLQYNLYNESDYSIIWDHYAYIHPVWSGDFGKWNLSASSTLQATSHAQLLNIYHDTQEDGRGFTVHLEHAFPAWLVRDAGAPANMWTTLASTPDSDALQLSVVWQRKTPTRLPEALWLRFRPGAAAVDSSSWRMRKLGSSIAPQEVIRNGSHSIHAVQDDGISVASADGQERLHIHSLDAPLVAMGDPIPFPNACVGPDMEQGMSFNLVNNVWGTNWPMWIPWRQRDVNVAFRFSLQTSRTQQMDVSGQHAGALGHQPRVVEEV